jgi:N-acetyl-gamma-glutamyl-phosphate reductase
MPVEVGIYGATGYTGLELVRLLGQHPCANIRFVTSETSTGKSLRQSYPLAPDLLLVSAADAPLDEVDSVFLCLPHTKSAPLAAQALEQGVRVVDLSADLRINDPAVYQKWYGVEHPNPELLPIPYGLPELGRDNLRGVNCIAQPGCYATGILLAVAPLARCNLLIPGAPLIVDAKSGVSGAGRAPKQNMLFAEVHGNFSPYNIGRNHRHLAEIEQVLAGEGYSGGPLIFSPYLLPTDRGILTTVYAQVHDLDATRQAFEDMYAGELLIKVLPPGELATLAHAAHTPYAVLSLTPTDGNIMIIISAIDNLLKGAASEAVQNFNLMWGFPETTSLLPC